VLRKRTSVRQKLAGTRSITCAMQNPVADNPSKATDFCIIVPCTFENLAENRPTVYSGLLAAFALQSGLSDLPLLRPPLADRVHGLAKQAGVIFAICRVIATVAALIRRDFPSNCAAAHLWEGAALALPEYFQFDIIFWRYRLDPEDLSNRVLPMLTERILSELPGWRSRDRRALSEGRGQGAPARVFERRGLGELPVISLR
jgi:hypothetical protein